MIKNSVRNPQPAHVRILVGRHVEQAEIAPAKIIGWLRIFVLRRLLLQPPIGIEGMLLAFEFFLIGELAAGLERTILRAHVLGVGTNRLRLKRAGATAPARDLQPGGKAFEIALLLGHEIAGHYVPQAASTKLWRS